MITGWLSPEDCPGCGYTVTWHATDPHPDPDHEPRRATGTDPQEAE